MEQIVKVKALNPDGTAEVECRRVSACGGNCAECGGCSDGKPQTMTVTAANPIGAKPGDQVVVTSSTGKVLTAVAAVYLLPLVMLIAGYCVWGLAAGLAGLILGFLGAVILDRRRAKEKKTSFTISAYVNAQEQKSEI